MQWNKNISFWVLLLMPAFLFAQNEEIIRSKNIISQTVYEYFIEEGLKDPVVERIERYDEDGNMIEEKEMNKEGDVREWMKYTYDGAGNKVEEIKINMRGGQEERIEWIYKAGLVVEKKYFDHKDRLVKRKEYKYETRGE